MSDAQNPAGQVRLERLYLKDASFESPRTPEVFQDSYKPEVQLDINSRTNTLGNNRYEVVLTATVRAKLESGKTAFIVEIQQAGVFLVEGVHNDVLRRVLGTVCLTALFPYVREAVDSLVIKGGFPALNLAPVNFDALFADALARAAQRSTEGAVESRADASASAEDDKPVKH